MTLKEKHIILRRMSVLLEMSNSLKDCERVAEAVDNRLNELYELASELGFTQDDLLDHGNNELLDKFKYWSMSGEAFQ